ncbi:hypothetical protein ABIB51_000225 [Arthrobacter sp. UYCu712]
MHRHHRKFSGEVETMTAIALRATRANSHVIIPAPARRTS